MRPRVAFALVFLCGAGCQAERAQGRADVTSTEEMRLAAEYAELVASYDRKTAARQISVAELARRLAEGADIVLLDVREREEHEVSALKSSRWLPPDRVETANLRLTPEATIVTFCTAGYRSGLAAKALEERLDRPVHNLSGGIIAWFNAGGEVVDPQGEPVARIHTYGPEWAKYVRTRPASE